MKATGRRFLALAAAAAVLTALGFAVRLGEDNQVGSSNDFSLWTWAGAAICAYWAVLTFVLLLKCRRHPPVDNEA